MQDSPHLIEKDIHASYNTGDFINKVFEQRIYALGDEYPSVDGQNANMWTLTIQELNRKLYYFGLEHLISGTYGPGFRPDDLSPYFDEQVFEPIPKPESLILFGGEPIIYNGFGLGFSYPDTEDLILFDGEPIDFNSFPLSFT